MKNSCGKPQKSNFSLSIRHMKARILSTSWGALPLTPWPRAVPPDSPKPPIKALAVSLHLSPRAPGKPYWDPPLSTKSPFPIDIAEISRTRLLYRLLALPWNRAGKWHRKKPRFLKVFFKNLKNLRSPKFGFFRFFIFWSNFIQIISNFIF